MAKGPRPRPVAERFWSKVRRTDTCWEWTGYRTPMGYGHFGWRRDGKNEIFLSHRVAWEITYGSFAEELCVCHHCDNPPCVRPDHLFLGTRTTNAKDRVRKGRVLVGAQHPSARLKEEEVRTIYAKVTSGLATGAEMARQYNVHDGTVNAIMTGRNWRHLNLNQQTSTYPKA